METRNLARLAAVAAVVLNVAGTAFAAGTLEIGWAEAEVTPPLTKRVPLDGQCYQRLADVNDPIHTRLKFVAVAFKKGGDYFLEGTIDNECVWGPWQDRVRARVHELVPEMSSCPRSRPAAETARGYGGGVNNGQIGHEGAFKLCDRAVEAVNKLFVK